MSLEIDDSLEIAPEWEGHRNLRLFADLAGSASTVPYFIDESHMGLVPLELIGLRSFAPEQYASAKPSGVVGDGTDDGPALAAASAALNAAGRGSFELKPGRTYYVGGQTLHNPSVDQFGDPGGVYRFYPNHAYVIDIQGCTGAVVLRLNGATIKCLDDAKFGTFNVDGTVMASVGGYTGDGIATPYFAMVNIENCTGMVYVLGPCELDGNIKEAVIGGFWGDTGRQIPCSGLRLKDSPNLSVDGGILSHHHGLDGCIGDGPGLLDEPENVIIRKVMCRNNGRQGISHTGGNGWVWIDCEGIGTGKDIGAMAASNPAAGIDFEAEGGKYVINTQVIRPRCWDNSGAGIVSDSNAVNTLNVTLYDPFIVGTTNWSLWPQSPGFKVFGGVIVGSIVAVANSLDPSKAFYAYRTQFLYDPERSPTGVEYGGFMDIGSQSAHNITFEECYFEKRVNSEHGFGQRPAADATGPFFINCTFNQPSGVGGHCLPFGIFKGERTTFINCQNWPGQAADAPWGGVDIGGFAADSFVWSYPEPLAGLATPATVPTRYKPNFDARLMKRVYEGSTVYDPPSLAAGAKTAIQTFALAGVAVADIVEEVTFSTALAGARVHAWVSAADTVSYYFINENGADPLDLASGTLKVKVRKA